MTGQRDLSVREISHARHRYDKQICNHLKDSQARRPRRAAGAVVAGDDPWQPRQKTTVFQPPCLPTPTVALESPATARVSTAAALSSLGESCPSQCRRRDHLSRKVHDRAHFQDPSTSRLSPRTSSHANPRCVSQSLGLDSLPAGVRDIRETASTADGDRRWCEAAA